MAIMVNNQADDSVIWQRALQTCVPDLPVYVSPDVPDYAAIKYAAVWHHPHDDLLLYENLKAVLLLGAGTDHIDQALELPDVPIVRLIDPAVGTDMSQYVLYWVMHFQRGYETYRDQQKAEHWQRYEYPLASEYQVTILGAGLIAGFIAERVAINGFKVNVWSRSVRDDAKTGVHFFHGAEGLKEALSGTQVLVNCLPLKAATSEFINKELLDQLPKGSHFINVSRGGVVDDQALLNALDDGSLQTAALDSITVEPLAKGHAFWSHPKIHITPHMSGATYTRTAAQVIADNIIRMEAGEAPFPIYTPS